MPGRFINDRVVELGTQAARDLAAAINEQANIADDMPDRKAAHSDSKNTTPASGNNETRETPDDS